MSMCFNFPLKIGMLDKEESLSLEKYANYANIETVLLLSCPKPGCKGLLREHCAGSLKGLFIQTSGSCMIPELAQRGHTKGSSQNLGSRQPAHMDLTQENPTDSKKEKSFSRE